MIAFIKTFHAKDCSCVLILIHIHVFNNDSAGDEKRSVAILDIVYDIVLFSSFLPIRNLHVCRLMQAYRQQLPSCVISFPVSSVTVIFSYYGELMVSS